MSWERAQQSSQVRLLNVRLGPPRDFTSGRSQDVSLGRPPDDQIESLGDVLGTLEGDVLGTSCGQIFASWVMSSSTTY